MKATAVSENKNAGVWGQNPQPLEANGGFGGGSSDAVAILKLLSKITHF